MTEIHQATQFNLRLAGLKATKARFAILHVLEEENRPLDVMEIEQYLREHDITINNVTVYRILEAFIKKRLVHRIEFQEGKARYEIAGREHHHLICEQCGKIDEIEDCTVDQLEGTIRKEKHFLVKRHSLEFFGICQDCQT